MVAVKRETAKRSRSRTVCRGEEAMGDTTIRIRKGAARAPVVAAGQAISRSSTPR
ncbi:hypothetical protein D3C85_1825400 [compost metagenome]